MVLQIRRGTAADVASESFVPAAGEPLWLTDEENLYIGDGATQGGNLVGGANDLQDLTSVRLISESIGTIESYSVATNVATVDLALNHDYSVGLEIVISDATATDINGTHTILSIPTGSQFTFSLTTADIASTVTDGTVTPNIPDGNVLAWSDANSRWENVSPNAGLEILNDTSPQLGGNLDTNGNDIVSTGTNDIDFDPAVGQNVVFRGNATDGSGRIVLNCEQNTHAITIQGPAHAAAANYTLILPTTDGDAGQYLITDGSGNLSWQTPSSELLYTRFRYNSAGTPGSVSAGSQLLGVDAALGSWSEMTFANNATNGTNIGSADFNPTLTGINTTTGIFDNIPVGVYRIDVALQLTINNLATNSYLRYNHLVQARNGATVISAIGQDFNFTTTGTAPGSAVTQDVKYSLTVHLESTTLANNDVRILLDQDQGPDYFCSVGFITFTKIA